jgi:ferritin-like metal-binding protein YciE
MDRSLPRGGDGVPVEKLDFWDTVIRKRCCSHVNHHQIHVMSRNPREHLVHFLSDLYSVELQALAQLTSAPTLAREPSLAEDFRAHHAETKQQAERVRQRLEALGGSPSVVKDAIMKLGGKGFLLFARMQTETPGRLVAHAYSYEAMEWAGYGMLIQLAEAAEDDSTREIARSIQAQERDMMRRLERGFDAAEDVSHRETPAGELPDHLRKHLAEVHAIESQSLELLKKAEDLMRPHGLAQIYTQHLEETRRQIAWVEQQLQALGADPSMLEDTLMKLGGLSWGMFFQSQTDTPAKLAVFAYAVEHLEIAAYELLRRVASRIRDLETEGLCQRILAEERSMTERLVETFAPAAEATLRIVRA